MIKFSRFSLAFLSGCNLLLLLASWVMMVYAYSRLPSEIPLWLNLAQQPVYKFPKSPIIFLYPMAQTAGCVIFWLVGRLWVDKPGKAREKHNEHISFSAKASDGYQQYIKREIVLLALVFYNLIFIHLERSLIWLAHGLAAGVNKVYFLSLILAMLLMIPYYRLRLKIARSLGYLK